MEVKVLEPSWTFQRQQGGALMDGAGKDRLILYANAVNSRAGLTTASRRLSRDAHLEAFRGSRKEEPPSLFDLLLFHLLS